MAWVFDTVVPASRFGFLAVEAAVRLAFEAVGAGGLQDELIERLLDGHGFVFMRSGWCSWLGSEPLVDDTRDDPLDVFLVHEAVVVPVGVFRRELIEDVLDEEPAESFDVVGVVAVVDDSGVLDFRVRLGPAADFAFEAPGLRHGL